MSTIQACWQHHTDTINQTLSNMLTASDYWQPDKQSRWISSQYTVGLAKAQLYNTSRAQADGVHHEAAFGLCITSNARIDNRNILLEKLGFPENDSRVETDGQLILQCYAKWGKDCAAHLRGDFVFVIWDDTQQKLFCARDHFGVKVLFYSKNERGVMLSNEHNAFFTSSWCDPNSVDERWLVESLWNLVPRDFASPNPNIKVLPPAHTLEIDSQGIKLTQYWHLQPKTTWQLLNDEKLIEELKARFQQAVVARLDSQYPLGAELSEGLDSNGIAGFAARYVSPQIIHTFSYQCEELNDENRNIWAATYQDIEAMLAMHENLQPVWQTTTPDNLNKQAHHQQQLFYQHFGGVIPRSGDVIRGQLTQERNIRVLLSGWGGDHCVSSPGDEYADELLRSGHIISLYRLLKAKYTRGRGRHPLRSLLVTAISQLAPRLNFYLKTKRPCLESAIQQRAKQHFLNQKWVSRFQLDTKLETFLRHYQRCSVRQHELRELFEIGLTNRLSHSELTARQCRLEYRFPMLDVDLVEFAHSLPGRLKIHRGIERYPFRRVLEGLTTQRIQWRRKADVDHPNIDRNSLKEAKQHYLAEYLKQSKLARLYSSENRLRKHLKSYDSMQSNSLEFMAATEAHYVRSIPRAAEKSIR